MKPFLSLAIVFALLPSCETLPDGSKVYKGPNLTVSTAYNGISLGVTLWGSTYTPQSTAPAKGSATGAEVIDPRIP